MTLDEFLSLSVEEQVRVARSLRTPEQQARSDAMVERAAVQSAAIDRARSSFEALMPIDAAQCMRAALIGLLLAEELRCRALGVPPPAWDETFARYGVVSGAALAVMRSNFSQEATH